MRRLSLVVVAAVASAMIVVGVTSLDAVGAGGGTATTKKALAGHVPKPADDATEANRLITCLRAHGAQPPSAPADLKRWIVQHQSDPAVANALKQCGVGPPPGCGDKAG